MANLSSLLSTDLKGNTGATGPTGPTGATGLTGATGPSGGGVTTGKAIAMAIVFG
jgi:hypothetical protein